MELPGPLSGCGRAGTLNKGTKARSRITSAASSTYFPGCCSQSAALGILSGKPCRPAGAFGEFSFSSSDRSLNRTGPDGVSVLFHSQGWSCVLFKSNENSMLVAAGVFQSARSWRGFAGRMPRGGDCLAAPIQS